MTDRDRRRFLRDAGWAAAASLLAPGALAGMVFGSPRGPGLGSPRGAAAGPGGANAGARGGSAANAGARGASATEATRRAAGRRGGLRRLAPARRKTKRVVFIAFAGGVRSRETIGTPANIPNLSRIAEAGFVLPSVRTENLGHYGATLSEFTGNLEAMGIRENAPGKHPTMFERLRRDGGLAADDVWLVASGGPQLRHLGASNSPDYGPSWGATQLTSDGILSAEFRSALDRFGSPRAPDPPREARIRRLRAAIHRRAGQPPAAAPPRPGESVPRAPDASNVLESLILRELAGTSARLTGPAAGDRKALQIATSILLGFRPSCLAVALFGADVAHRSFNDYVEVIRRRDEEIGKIFDAILTRPELREDTTILVLPEFGRDHDLNQRNGLDHGDHSDDLLRVAAIGYGPDFRSRIRPRKPIRTIDFAPTILELLGTVAPRDIEGRVLRELLAS